MAPKPATDDYYEILQINPVADEVSIRTSYLRLAKERHPDKNPGDESAKVRFQLVSKGFIKLVSSYKQVHGDDLTVC